MKKTMLHLFVLPFLALVFQGRADIVIWQEDFSDVSDWSTVFNLQGDASLFTSDGSLGDMYIQVVNNEVAFSANTHFAFNPADKNDYTMSYTVDNLTGSVSYDVRLDMFDASDSYVGTVFGVVPQGTFTGTDTVNLGGFTFDPNTASLSAKISVFTGPDFGDQNVRFDTLSFSQVPEPSVISMLLTGVAALVFRKRRTALALR